MSSSQQVTPFSRPLPWDILLLVIAHSANSTLTSLACVSLDLLKASTSLLYRDITITSLKQLQALFCHREEDAGREVSSPHRSGSLHFVHL